ncbi:BnaC02g29740D [Brassica napus]|uniref:(rape) hypothetical protein n=1 Tax=Brassica napus TaxID=3708 RepID=A0A078FJ27_BRANA|nr:unnamed protein product [Brassica napus]CDY12967.1 BnaC02g29740D [Brassica napus]
MKIDKARLPELEIIYLELKMKVSRSAAIESPKERNNVEKLLVPFKSTWKEKGVTIVLDGWRDPTGKFLISSIATSRSVPIFFKVVNCFGEVKDRFFISDLMQEVINEKNETTYEECNWITDTEIPTLIAVLDTRFTSIIVMLKRVKLIKKNASKLWS